MITIYGLKSDIADDLLKCGFDKHLKHKPFVNNKENITDLFFGNTIQLKAYRTIINSHTERIVQLYTNDYDGYEIGYNDFFEIKIMWKEYIW